MHIVLDSAAILPAVLGETKTVISSKVLSSRTMRNVSVQRYVPARSDV